jgi:hypothetical protein
MMSSTVCGPADAVLLHAAEPGDLGRDDALVDADYAVFEALGDTSDAANVAAVEIGREPKFGVVRHLDRLRLGLEAVERRYRAERFLLGDNHVGDDVSQYSRLEDAAAQRRTLAVYHDRRTFADRIGDMRFDLSTVFMSISGRSSPWVQNRW